MLLSLRTAARTHLPSTLSHRRPDSAALLRKPALVSYFRSPLRPSPFSIRMSSSDLHPHSNSSPKLNQVIEHIVLFKVKPDADPSAVDAMTTNLNGLISLEEIIHISAAPVSRCRSNSLAFTHMLHSRHGSKSDLASYAVHPAHVSVVTNNVKPVIDDIMAVDWVASELSGAVVVSPGSAVRLTVLKVKEGAGEAVKSDVLKVLRGIMEKFPSIEQLTAGENFSPGRAKGFSVASIAIFKGAKELEEFDAETETLRELKDKAVGEFVEDVLVLDYTVATSVQTASL